MASYVFAISGLLAFSLLLAVILVAMLDQPAHVTTRLKADPFPHRDAILPATRKLDI